MSKKWKWMPGMLFDGLRIFEVNSEGVHFAPAHRGASFFYFDEMEGIEPDTTDFATRGCLFGQFCAVDEVYTATLNETGGVDWTTEGRRDGLYFFDADCILGAFEVLEGTDD